MTMSTTPPEPAKRPPGDRGQGRKPIAPEERAVIKSMRLKPAHWAMHDELGGVDWLRITIEAAHRRLNKPE